MNIPLPIIIPSETQSREFDGKLFLSCLLADRGHDVYVGSRIAIHNRISSLPRGVYLAKDFRASSVTIFNILKRLGHSIVAWDEEGILFFDEAEFLQRRVAPAAFQLVEQFYAWGPSNKSFIEAAPCFAGVPVFTTGNPRVDLTRPELRSFFAAQISELKDRYGKFILVNTNFGKVNHFLPKYVVQPGKNDPSLRGVAMTPHIEKSWIYRRELFEHFLTMVQQLAGAFPDYSIVIRPHPAENHDTWTKAAAKLKNIHVVHEGNVYPWLLACSAMVHNGCTTGIEGFLLDAPVISYRPIQSKDFDLKLANDLSHQVYDFNGLVRAIRDASTGKLKFSKSKSQLSIISPYVGSLTGHFASELISQHISDFARQSPKQPEPGLVSVVRGKAEAKFRHLVKWANSFRKQHKNSWGYSKHRFPGLSEADVNKKIVVLSELLGSFKEVRASKIKDNIFVVRKLTQLSTRES